MQLRAQYQGKELESKVQSMKLDLLNRLIEDRIILREAKASNIQVDESRIKERVNELKKRYSSDMDFQRSLSQQGLTQADIETKIREQFLTYGVIDAKVKSKVVVNPREVTEFYEQNTAKFYTSEGRQLEVIVVDKEDFANQVYKDLKSGSDFNDTAAKFALSVDKINASKDGELNREIEAVVFNLKPSEISRPIKIGDTFYIFKFDNIIPPRQQSLLEVQDKIYTFIFEQKMQEALGTWLNELKKQAYIKILQD
jgi:peptidyl-prolyl cis-trans isomerase SurA